MRYYYLLFLSMLFFAQLSLAQQTKIRGKVTDQLTNEPIPFATVVFKGTTVGTNTDFDGNYVLITNTPGDSVVCTLVGYQTVKMRVKKGQDQMINIVLKASKVELQEVVIKAGENPANIIFREIIKHKFENDHTKLSSFQYEVYNKLEFDLTNISDKMKKNKLLKPFAFVWDNIDSNETNSKPFLPFFISETLSDLYYRSSPSSKQEIIKASKVSGLENASVTQFLGDMYQRVNVYDNFIELFGKGFISPASDLGLVYYRYYLLDSAFLDNQWCYKMKFKPRRPQELTFSGDFWVHDTTFAIKKISMRIAHDANINWVEDMAIVQEYTRVDDVRWMLMRDMLVLDFAARQEGMSFIGRKSTTYRKIKVNHTIPDEIFKGTEIIRVNDDALNKTADYWDINRHDSLAEREQKIYHMVDTIKTLPAFKTYVELITLFFTGYKDIGLIELGPYYTVYSSNPVEGNRFRIGMRTSDDLSTKIQLEGYLAYGLKDERFKYMGAAKFKISDKPRQFTGVQYRFDIEQLGQSDNAFQDDNILSSVFRRNPANKLNSSRLQKLWYEIEWFPGLSNKVTLSHNEFHPLGKLDISYFTSEEKNLVVNTFQTTQLSMFMRFAYREKFVAGKVDRISLGSEHPIIQINYTKGIKGFLEGDFDYHKLSIRIDDRLKLNPFGYTYWVLSAGRTWGKVPYPLLEIHPGNETYFYDYAAFNMMNFFEFVSDYYLSGFATHHFDGFFLDKIPLLRKLKWREVAQVKAVWGELSTSNLNLQANQSLFYSLNKKPYVEAGVGVENIFKILRVDFLWRMSYLENPNISKFGIRGSFQLTF
ncbi:MAG: carboxypeptidase-like regulatory domain-containing protein [Bacteroidetes bacterium]|nr:carboxypeptidase-like regulatory domain-containing protein [Bacteroidota bacterium]